MKSNSHISVFWFRRDLRLYDNHGFFEALRSGCEVLPIFIFDKLILQKLSDTKDKRISFLHQTLKDLSFDLQIHRSSLLVLHDEPLNAFKTVCEWYSVKHVFTNNDYEPYAIDRDFKIQRWLEMANVQFHSYKDQVIFEKDELLKSDGTPYTIFTPYSKIWKQKYSSQHSESYPSEKLLSNLVDTSPFHFPKLSDLGFENAAVDFPQALVNSELIRTYHLTRNIPSLSGTSQLSIHLRFGTISIRELTDAASNLNEQWLNELIWRDFFMMILFQYPHVVNNCFKRKYEKIKWRNNEFEFEKWCNGETGYPIVDAGMRQLNQTGFMHNRVRMIVASFLTKHLLIDWRWGEAYFAEKLFDYELSSNNGNWQWAAGCGCDAAPYFRIFNPTEQLRKFDPELKYVRKWIENFTPDYLKPIVEHKIARDRALGVFKEALNDNF